jgi:hypothetical protein
MFLGGMAVTDPVRTAADVALDLLTADALRALRRLGELTGVRPHQVIKVLATMRYARRPRVNWSRTGPRKGEPGAPRRRCGVR